MAGRHKEFKPSKALGQNFLIDKNIAQKIVRLSGCDKSYGVLEIGPGHGMLTNYLAQSAGHVAALELDRRVLPTLNKELDGCGNVTLIYGDILKTDIAELAALHLKQAKRMVCANLPYNITTPAITRLIESGVFESITVMVQKEVAKRICAVAGCPDYSAFSVFVNYHAKSGLLFDVPPECFSPRPKVTSAVVKMTLNTGRLCSRADEEYFFRIVRSAFSQRRKTLVNALHSAYSASHSKDDIAAAVTGCGFDIKVRGEELGVREFIELSKALRGNPEAL